jgi:hypothetical protein
MGDFAPFLVGLTYYYSEDYDSSAMGFFFGGC